MALGSNLALLGSTRAFTLSGEFDRLQSQSSAPPGLPVCAATCGPATRHRGAEGGRGRGGPGGGRA
eukprot:6323574-Alexandrium_andersonii.AAC.1